MKDRHGRKSMFFIRMTRSLLCGLAAAMTCILRPIISFYLSNEGEFWFSLESVIGQVLLVFGGVAIVLAVIHFLLPQRRKNRARLVFAALVAAGSLCVLVQNHFLSSYLPVLTGDPIDWSLYPRWNSISIALWGSVFGAAVIIALARPRFAKATVYGLLAMILSMEVLTCGIELATAKHEEKKELAYFTTEGLYETADAGNVVLLISDTFQGTYMNEVLERYPEYREMLSDCTYYDNVTGTSCFTYFSYANIMTGVDFPIGADMERGISYCFDHQSTIDKVVDQGWDVEYYTTFSPTESVADRLMNYCGNILVPRGRPAWKLTGLLLKSTLFQSMPHPLKKHFLVYTQDYEEIKKTLKLEELPEPYVVSDNKIFERLTSGDAALTKVSGNPRYSIVELHGVHEPCRIDADFNKVEYAEDFPIAERKVQGARGQLKFLRAYLDQLKAAGTYDQTTVIMTADHGYDLRFYPVFLVKEAHREDTGFIVDHSPLSMQEDYQKLLEAMTSGETFSDAVSALDLPPDRERYAVDYSSMEGYALATDRKSIVTITGDARDERSYNILRDEYMIDDGFGGRCILGEPFYTGEGNNGNAAVYGIYDNTSIGHTVIFDMFLDKKNESPLEFRIKLKNVTEINQQLLFSIAGKTIAEDTITTNETKELFISIPEQKGERVTVEMSIPDAVLRSIPTEVAQWNWYLSVYVVEAGLYERST